MKSERWVRTQKEYEKDYYDLKKKYVVQKKKKNVIYILGFNHDENFLPSPPSLL